RKTREYSGFVAYKQGRRLPAAGACGSRIIRASPSLRCSMQEILVLYYSHRGSVRALAEEVARGVHAVPGMAARVRTVPRVSAVCEAVEDEVPADGPPYVEVRDLEECAGLVLGSPTRFGN